MLYEILQAYNVVVVVLLLHYYFYGNKLGLETMQPRSRAIFHSRDQKSNEEKSIQEESVKKKFGS